VLLTGHEHLVLVVLVRVCEDIGTLQRLWEETEDVVDNQESRFGVLGTGGIRLHAIDGDPLALLFVALGDDGRDGAASFGLCRHGCELSCVVVRCVLFETCSCGNVEGRAKSCWETEKSRWDAEALTSTSSIRFQIPL
jgi:hypothetical protein